MSKVNKSARKIKAKKCSGPYGHGPRKTYVNFRIPRDLVERVDDFAEKYAGNCGCPFRSRQDAVVFLVREGLEREGFK